MYDDGSGEAPDSHPQTPSLAGPFCYAWADINKEELEPGYYEMWVDLPENLMMYACEKYWISIWGVGQYPPQSGWGYHSDPILLQPAVWGSNYFGLTFWTPGYDVLGFDHDMCFQLTSKPGCDPSIDVEKYIWDPDTQEWLDCDTEDEAIDFKPCTEITYKIVIENTGTCELYDVIVKDKLHESVEFLKAVPEPASVEIVPPDTLIEWYFDVLDQTQVVEIIITGHVRGEECSYDYNYVLVQGTCPHGKTVRDEDWCWIHVGPTSRIILQNRLLAQIFERFPNAFPLLRQLLSL
jgi:uncharacterized repeat protein (TIGR01451 family)